MSMFGAFAASDPASQQNNFNPSWMGQTFNASSGVPRPTGRPNASNGGEGEEDRPMSAPIFMRNRYGREDILAMYNGGSVHPPDDLTRCPLFIPEPQNPCVVKPLTETEKKLRENINSSKAMSLLSATDRHHITSGGALPESPQGNRGAPNNANGWTHVPSREHNKTWGRSSMTTTGTTPVRGSVRGAFTGGRGGGIAGGGAEGGVSPTSYGGGGTPQNGERALGTGGTFPSRRGVNPVGRGGSSTANSFNSRAQGLYNPHDPSDRPRQRGRSTSEEAEAGATPTTPGAAPAASAAAAGGGGVGGQANTWQSRQQTAWGRGSDQQRMPEWAHDDEGGLGGGIVRDTSAEVSSGTFDEQGRFMAARGPFPRGGQSVQQMQQQHHQNAASMQHDQYVQQQPQQRVSPPSSVQTAAWGGSEERTGGVPLTTPIDIPSHSSSHYSMGGSITQPQQPDLQSGVSGMSPSSAFLFAYQQQQQQQHIQQQQQLQQQQHYAAMQQAAQQQQPPQPAAPAKPVQFFYRDPTGLERGPFTLDQMEAWFNMGYFQSSLEVRRESDTQFTELGELQKRNGKNPFKYPEPAPVPALPTPTMLAGYMDHQMGLGNSGGWDQSVQNIFQRAQNTNSYEALLEKQRMEEQTRRMIEEREQMVRVQEMMQRQAETEREKKERELKEKEMEIMRKQEEMVMREREIEAAKRQHELILEEQKREIEKKRIELEQSKNRDMAEKRAKEEAENRKKAEIEERKRIEEQRRAAEEEEEREKERTKKRAEEAKRLLIEEKKRQEEERRMAEAFAKAEELRLEAEREQAAERERLAQIAAARRAAAPAAPAASVWEVPTPTASGNTTPVVPKVPSGPAWGGAGLSTVSPSKKNVENRSLAEVMAEEERQARAEARENERMRREVEAAAPKSKGGAVWGGSTPSSISSLATPLPPSGLAWGGAGAPSNGPAKPSPWAGPSLSEANKPKAAPAKPAAAKAKAPEKKKDEKKKSAASAESTFISWFIGRARQLNDTVDGEVLATFIQDISNPDEVEDYMVGYLGEGKQVKEFVREYIHKRSELRNKAKGDRPGPSHDSMSSATNNDGFSSVGKKNSNNQNNKKKAKFVVDSACLGFRPTGDPNRVNQGEIDHPETAGRR